MRRILFAVALALFGAASAAAQPVNLPDHTVWGRLGTGSSQGPAQAIPFATLSSQLSGATITLNSGNGQTAPGAMSGGNTYSFGATTDTPQMKGLGLGGTAPATGLEIWNAAIAPTGTGQLAAGASSTNGGVYGGQGSLYDACVANDALNCAIGVPTGTQNVVLLGTLTAASLATSGTVAGSICSTSAGAILYKSAANCFAVSGISVASGKTVTFNNTLTFNGTDGTTFTLPGSSDTLGALGTAQTWTATNTFSGTVNFTGTAQLNGTAFGTFATQNYATPPAIGGTTPAAGAFTTLSATTPIGLSSGGTNAGTAAGARASGALNIDELTSHGDSSYTILATDRKVGTSATLTAARTWTLPAASALNPGQELIVQDFKGAVSGTNTLTIQRSGSDTLNGASTSVTINSANGGYLFVSDGISNWSAQALGAQASSGVSSLNGATGTVNVVAGTGIGVSTAGGNITANCQTSTSSQIGCAEPDNSTIKATAGVYATQNTTVAGATCTPGSSCGLTSATNAIGSNINLTSQSTFFDGPSTNCGSACTSGTWFAFGSMTVSSTSADVIVCKLWDGTNVIASNGNEVQAGSVASIAMAGPITGAAGNIKVSCSNLSSTHGTIQATSGSQSNASVVSVLRVQ